MKQSDIVTIVAVAFIGIFFSYFLVNSIVGDPNKENVTFSTVERVDSTVGIPDDKIFNVNAINPTVEVYLGSCVDADQDNVISEAENAACRKNDSE